MAGKKGDGGEEPVKRMAVVTMLLACATVHAQEPKAQPRVIDKDTTWTGAVTVDGAVRVTKGTLTIAPGSVVTFKPGGTIDVGREGTLQAKGAVGAPVRLAGEKAGQITGHLGKVLLERCEITGMGSGDPNRVLFISMTAGEGGVTLRDCTLTGCGGIWVTLSGPFEMSRCDLRDARGGLRLWGKGAATVSGNTITGAGVGIGEGAAGVIRDNVVLGGTLSGWRTDQLLIEGNYVHNPYPKGSYGISGGVGVIRNNVIRGGSWVTAQIGGEIRDNVFISLPHEEARKLEGGFDKNCTHEHICGLVPNSKVVRNLFVGASYGAVMGIGGGTASDSVIRNNTFDMRGSGNALYLNHLPKSDPKNVVARNNIFMRSGTVLSEKPVHDTFSAVDYNLWSKSGLDKRRGRFWKVTMTGKKEGDAGFGANDVPPYGKDDDQPAPDTVVVNPEVEFPFTDEDMLAGKHTVAELLAHYRAAYALKPGSPAIDAGDPADKDDPEVKDGKPDIGAVEAGRK